MSIAMGTQRCYACAQLHLIHLCTGCAIKTCVANRGTHDRHSAGHAVKAEPTVLAERLPLPCVWSCFRSDLWPQKTMTITRHITAGKNRVEAVLSWVIHVCTRQHSSPTRGSATAGAVWGLVVFSKFVCAHAAKTLLLLQIMI